jgi:hypothetical protein
MSEPLRALTGPIAAAMLKLDGFRDLEWPLLWCAPISVSPMPDLIRTRRWTDPSVIHNQLVAAPHLILRHLNALPEELTRQPDGLSMRDRVAYATEDALRKKLVRRKQLRFGGGDQNGSYMLREYLAWLGDERATDSYAETGFSLIMDENSIPAFRQVKIFELGKVVHRCDFAIPLWRRFYLPRRPKLFLPAKYLLIEVDSRQFHDHDPGFEKDHDRDLTYRRLGYPFLCFTANQIQHRPDFVLGTVQHTLDQLLGAPRIARAEAA